MKKSMSRLSGYHISTLTQIREFSIVNDLPPDEGGEDTGSRPMEMLLGALGSCIVMTVKMYADHKKWDVSGLEVEVILEDQGENQTIKKMIKMPKGLDDIQQKRILSITEKCPVSKLLSSGIAMQTHLVI